MDAAAKRTGGERGTAAGKSSANRASRVTELGGLFFFYRREFTAPAPDGRHGKQPPAGLARKFAPPSIVWSNRDKRPGAGS